MHHCLAHRIFSHRVLIFHHPSPPFSSQRFEWAITRSQHQLTPDAFTPRTELRPDGPERRAIAAKSLNHKFIVHQKPLAGACRHPAQDPHDEFGWHQHENALPIATNHLPKSTEQGSQESMNDPPNRSRLGSLRWNRRLRPDFTPLPTLHRDIPRKLRDTADAFPCS